MGRKKGKQSFGFTNKAQRATFATEWQTHVSETVESLRQRRNHINSNKHQRHHSSTDPFSSSSSNSTTNTISSTTTTNHQHRILRLKTLRNILQERVFQDELEHRETSRLQRRLLQQQQQQQQPQSLTTISSSASLLPPPGSLIYYTDRVQDDDDDDDDDDDGVDEDRHTNHHTNDEYPLPQHSSRSSCGTSIGHNITTSTTSSSTTTPLLSLQMLCVQTLGPLLPEYIHAMGVETVHHCLSLLPGTTLAALSVVIAQHQRQKQQHQQQYQQQQPQYSPSSTLKQHQQQHRHQQHRHTIKMTRELVHVLGSHSHVQRLALYHITDATMLDDLIPRVRDNVPLSQLQVHVPDCWEDDIEENDDDDDDNEASGSKHHHHDKIKHFYCDYHHACQTPSLLGCTQLQRLELAHLLVGCRRWTMVEPVRQLLDKCGTTLQYISFIHCLHVHTGPGLLLLLPTLVPHLRMIDVSDNDWIMESLLRQFWQGYLDRISPETQDKRIEKDVHDDDDDHLVDGQERGTDTEEVALRIQQVDGRAVDDDDDGDDESVSRDNLRIKALSQRPLHLRIKAWSQRPLPQHVLDLLPVVRAISCPNLITSMRLALDVDFPDKLIHTVK